MRQSKFIPMVVFIALLLGQVALAQHSASHIDHGVSHHVTHYDHDHSHNHEQDEQDQTDKKTCPECVLTQSLQVAYYNAPASIAPQRLTVSFAGSSFDAPIYKSFYRANTPRAPPAFLI